MADPHLAHGKFVLEESAVGAKGLNGVNGVYGRLYRDCERVLVSRRWARKPYVVLGACGMHGALEIGGLASIIGGMGGDEFLEWRRRLKGAGGVSIGAFITTLIALGMDLTTISAVYKNFPFDVIFKDDAAAALTSITGIESLSQTSGIMTGASLRTAVYAAFKLLGIRLETTFEDLARAAEPGTEPFDLRILATDILNLRAVVFSARTTPKVPLIDAVVASMSIPAMFRPTTIPGHGIFVDGGVVDPFGLDLFPDQTEKQQVLYIIKLNNIEPENRAFSMPQVLNACLSVRSNYYLGRQPHLKRIDVMPQFAGAHHARDETEMHNPFHVFDLPNVTELVLDGCVSVESSVLLFCILAMAITRIASRA